MISRSRLSQWIVVAVAGFALVAGIVALSPDLQARPHETPNPPDQCTNCPPPYIGPNGGVCQPLGCVRNGTCVLGGDCF